MNFFVLLAVFCCLTAAKQQSGRGSKWWGIAKGDEPNNLLPMSPGMLSPEPLANSHSLRKKQQILLKENPGTFNAVAWGAKIAVQECQYQFKDRRWNCSTKNFLRGKNLFGKIVDRGVRETAFIYAIMSAAVTHAVARACSEGTINTCTCDYSHQGKVPAPIRVAHHQALGPTNTLPGVRDWEWGGCSDNLAFGFSFSRRFVDTGERGRNMREKMNLHNNEAGRHHVSSNMKQECKCHGMSGSCTVKTCWMRLPNFREVGDQLKDRFDGASRITLSNNPDRSHSNKPDRSRGNNPDRNRGNNPDRNRGNNPERKRGRKYNLNFKPFDVKHMAPDKKDLVYLDLSPSFCERDPKWGIPGTHGRICNASSIGVDGCDLMCCERGYEVQDKVFKERCNCIFRWCCEVKCDICSNKKIVHTCR